MGRLTGFTAIALATVVVAGCDNGKQMAPADSRGTGYVVAGRGQLADSRSADSRSIEIKDACDPTTFAAVGAVCVRNGGVTFTSFTDLLAKHHQIGSWHFAPGGTINAPVGQVLLATNRGGEFHTFTEVAAFGGGIIPLLNELSGNPVPAPECGQANLDLIAPGSVDDDEVVEPGIEHYQCCIHPWMRLTVVGH